MYQPDKYQPDKYQPDKLAPVTVPDTKPLNDVQRHLIEARKLIERGWCQGDDEFRGSYCMMGAITRVAPNCSAVFAADNVLRKVIGEFSSVADWNDSPSRTKAEVLAAFDRAVEIAGRG